MKRRNNRRLASFFRVAMEHDKLIFRLNASPFKAGCEYDVLTKIVITWS
jgi:hypothetical protein